MKIELTEKEYNTIDDILYEFAHHSKKGGAYFGYGIYNIQSQRIIKEMRHYYALLPVKPEWCSIEDIDNYEQNIL